MPALCVFFGSTSISFLFEKVAPSGAFEYFNFPYVYSKEVFANFVTESDFHKAIFDQIFKTRREKLSNYDVFTSGYLKEPQLPFVPKAHYELTAAGDTFEGIKAMVFDGLMIQTPEGYTSFVQTQSILTGKPYTTFGKDTEEQVFYANKSIYPQLVTPEMATQIDLDRDVIYKCAEVYKEFSGKMSGSTTIFTGGRFASKVCTEELNYILILDTLKTYGFNTVYLDSRNLSLLLYVYKNAQANFDEDISHYFEPEAYIVKIPSEVECLLTTETGASQLITVPKNKIYIIPMDYTERAKVQIKSPLYGSVEKTIKGARTGLIFDTRETPGFISDDMKLLNDTIDQFSRILASAPSAKDLEIARNMMEPSGFVPLAKISAVPAGVSKSTTFANSPSSPSSPNAQDSPETGSSTSATISTTTTAATSAPTTVQTDAPAKPRKTTKAIKKPKKVTRRKTK